MAASSETAALPSFVALEVLPVLAGEKRAASIQLTTTYLENRAAVLTSLDSRGTEKRVDQLRKSRKFLDNVSITVDAVETEALRTAAEDVQESLQELPEVEHLRSAYPGECVVVPEFLRTETGIQFGQRVYFFRDGEAPPATELIRRNVEAVVDEAQRAFEDYQGELHGYPECCVDHFTDRQPASPSPEQRSLAPLDASVHDDLVGIGATVSIERIVDDVFETEYAFAFCSRKFFPEPRCGAAQSFGRTLYETLTSEFELDGELVRDLYRLNVALGYLLAQTGRDSPGELPEVGDLGTEHVCFHLPLKSALTVSKYE